MSLPRFNVKTEFTFRKTFAPIKSVADRLSAIGVQWAAIADNGTWGHARWEQACDATEVTPGFGFSFRIDEGPMAIMLARDPAVIYAFVSAQDFSRSAIAAARDAGAVILSEAPWHDEADGLVDYGLITPHSRYACAMTLRWCAVKNKPYAVGDEAVYPMPEDRDTYLALTGQAGITPQHIMTEAELRAFFGDELIDGAANEKLAAEIGAARLAKAPMIHFEGDLPALVEEGKRWAIEQGRIDWNDEYQARLDREMQLIDEKDFASYFLVVADLVSWAKKHMLVGPGRGSSAGSLVCYLLRITEVDPLKHGLLFERFIDINRADLPDIDIDFSHKRRPLVFEYLAEKYGAENTARLGSINTLKARSAMMECGKRLAIPGRDLFKVRDVLIEYSSGDARFGKGFEDTLANTGPGKRLAEEHPNVRHMVRVENHAWHTGQHAAGVVVSNRPVTEFCAVVNGIAQVDKKGAEYLNLLKIDALGLTTLGVIEDAGVVTGDELYALDLSDQRVFDVFNSGKFTGIFQFEGAAQRSVASEVNIKSFREIDHVTALARPGPLGGGAAARYVDAAAGRSEVKYLHPILEPYLSETYGVVLYQEQVMKIVKEIGNFSWEDTSTVRKAMSGRKGEEFFNRMRDKFIAGAVGNGVPEEVADAIWKEVYSFGAWGMNASHTCSYAVVSYWCGWMKAYHPVEYAAALLRNTDDDERIVALLRELRDEGVPITLFDVDRSGVDWAAIDGEIIGGFKNLKGIGPVKAKAIVQRRDKGQLTPADLKLIESAELKISHLSEAHHLWGHLYENPEGHGIGGPIKQFGDLEDGETAVVIAKLVRLERRDENEQVRIMRRGGERMEGQTKFLDMFLVDDSVSMPIRVRVGRRDFPLYGDNIADNARPGRDWFLIRGRWLGKFNMMSVNKIRCLTNDEVKTGA